MKLGTRDRCWIWALAALVTVGCAPHKDPFLVENQPPQVRITAAPIDTTVRCQPDPVQSCYALTLYWVGHDPDGRVDHYLFTIDPPAEPGADTVWQVSRNHQERLVFPSRQGIPTRPHELPLARDFHVFVIKAVDNLGQTGPPTRRAFFSYTQAPDAFLIDPLPSSLSTPVLPPSVRINWRGTDDDGVLHDRPVRYKYILLTESSPFPVDSAVRFPDRLRERFAPGFAGWDSVGGDTTTVQYTNLVPDQAYVFVVVAFDEAGAYSPIMSLEHNMLRFRVGYAGVLGPKITVFNEFFNHTWRGGYCPTCPPVFIEVPAGRPITFNWFATPTAGSDIRCYRWALDIDDVFDDTPRDDDARDMDRWSSCQLGNTSITLGPFAGTVSPNPPEEHRLYVECRDNIGLRSLAIVHFQVVRADMRPGSILVVKDTRFQPDALDRNTGCTLPQPASVPWPSQAELDTFLFARGNAPWRCMPSGTISPPGLFAGYSFDTLGTRGLWRQPTVPLSLLSRYEHVVWIVDPKAASIDDDQFDFRLPPTSLRYMTAEGRFNTLGAHVKQGGKVWLMGGGGGYASMIEWNSGNNDVDGTVFSEVLSELRPGRLMFDLARWQSEFRVRSVLTDLRRFAGRHEHHPGDHSYTHHLSELPARIEPKTPATDPMPPQRTRPSDFYRTVATLEYLSAENHVVENVSDDPEHPREVPALDSLYADGGPSFSGEQRRITMTYYHGPTVPQGFLFSGFDVWTYRRAHCQAVVDFVLGRIWGLPKTSLAAQR